MASPAESAAGYDRAKEVREFDETRGGVKGLVDSGIEKVPRMFHFPSEELPKPAVTEGSSPKLPRVPVTDFQGFDHDSFKWARIVGEIRRASETWGIFQVVNHSIPTKVMQDMLDAVKQFHELPKEEKMPLYSRDRTKRVRFFSDGFLYAAGAASWRDTVLLDFADDPLDLQCQVPSVLIDAAREYRRGILMMGKTLREMISESLGLERDYLREHHYMEGVTMTGQYYPSCPEPELTLGASKHSDPTFLTILIQDSIGGLQVLYQDDWIDCLPIEGALVVNMGEIMQLITNGKSVATKHRVLVGSKGPRVSTACFFNPTTENERIAPLKELLSDDNPAIYKETSLGEYRASFGCKGKDGISGLPALLLQ